MAPFSVGLYVSSCVWGVILDLSNSNLPCSIARIFPVENNLRTQSYFSVYQIACALPEPDPEPVILPEPEGVGVGAGSSQVPSGLLVELHLALHLSRSDSQVV